MELSYSENKVYMLVLTGISNKKISSLLGVSEKTVKFHLTNIFAKKKCSSRSELIARKNDERITIDELRLFKTLLSL